MACSYLARVSKTPGAGHCAANLSLVHLRQPDDAMRRRLALPFHQYSKGASYEQQKHKGYHAETRGSG